MMIFVQLRKRHLPQRDDQAASSGKQRQTNRSITLPLCPDRQIADSWILFNSGAFAARWKAKAVLPLRAATLKQQAMITRHSGKAASGKLVWNQHKSHIKRCGYCKLKYSSKGTLRVFWSYSWHGSSCWSSCSVPGTLYLDGTGYCSSESKPVTC